MLASWIASILLFLAVPIAGGGGTMHVHCDAGDNLQIALDKVAQAGTGRIAISGVCRGNFTFSGDDLQLDAASPGATLLAHEAYLPVLHIQRGRLVAVRGLRMTEGELGLRAADVGALSVLDAEFKGNQVGLYLEQNTDAFISNTRIEQNQDGGLALRTGANASLVGGAISGNGRIGVSLLHGARVALNDTEISGHTEIGLSVWILCSANLRNVILADNGGAHILARDRARVQLVSGIAAGAAGDATQIGAYVSEQSMMAGFSTAEIFGDVIVQDAAYVNLGAVAVHGSFIVSEFGRVRLRQTAVDGMLLCDSGGDAYCSNTGPLLTAGCPSAPADCQNAVSTPADAPTPALPAPGEGGLPGDDRPAREIGSGKSGAAPWSVLPKRG